MITSMIKDETLIAPYRLRLRDASIKEKTRNEPIQYVYPESPRREVTYPSRVVSRMHSCCADDFFGRKPVCNTGISRIKQNSRSSKASPDMEYDLENNHTLDQSEHPVWIPSLEMWFFPSTSRENSYQKHVAHIPLEKRQFGVYFDPAPHVPKCDHYGGITAENSGERLEQLRELKRKERSDKAKARILALKEIWSKQSEVSSNAAMERLEHLKRARVAYEQKLKRQSEEREYRIQRLLASKARLQDDIKKKLEQQRSIPKSSSPNKFLARNPKSNSSPTKKTDPFLPSLKQKHSVNIKEIEGSDISDDSSDEEPAAEEEASDSLEPSLEPVQMPDWVREFMEKKRRAREELAEAALRGEELKTPISVVIQAAEEVDDDRFQETELQPSVSYGNLSVRIEDFSTRSNSVRSIETETAFVMTGRTPKPIGLSTRIIPDTSISASSHQDPYHVPSQARLNNEHNGKHAGVWCPKKHDQNQWVQFDLGSVTSVQQIATQGTPLSSVRRPKDKRWVESYAVSYSDSGKQWTYYEDEYCNPKVFIANTDLVNTSINSLETPLQARYIRIHPVSWHNGIAPRVEFYGLPHQSDEKASSVKTAESERKGSASTLSTSTHDLSKTLASRSRLSSQISKASQVSYMNKELVLPSSSSSPDLQQVPSEKDTDDSSGTELQHTDACPRFNRARRDALMFEEIPLVQFRSHSVTGSAKSQRSEVSVLSRCTEENKNDETPNEVDDIPVADDDGTLSSENDDSVSSRAPSLDMTERSNSATTESSCMELEEIERKYYKKKLPRAQGDGRIKAEIRRQKRADERKARLNKLLDAAKKASPSLQTTNDLESKENSFDFLSKYCILTDKQESLYIRVFEQFGGDKGGLLSDDELIYALKAINLNLLPELEMNYVFKIMEIFEVPQPLGVDIRSFSVMAAFAEKIKTLDAFTRALIKKTDFSKLYLSAYKARVLFESLLEKYEITISIEQLLLELQAGNISRENRELVEGKLRHKVSLDFLDFLIYLPLFLYTHDNILKQPLDLSK